MTMAPSVALTINAIMVDAYMIRNGFKSEDVPDVGWFSLREAEDAATMMRDTGIGRARQDNGTTTFTCFVEPSRVRSLYAWALTAYEPAENAT